MDHYSKAVEGLVEAVRHAYHKSQHPQAASKLREAIAHAESHAREVEIAEGVESSNQFRQEFKDHVANVTRIMGTRGTRLKLNKSGECQHEALRSNELCKCGYLQKSLSMAQNECASLLKSMASFSDPVPNPKVELLHKVAQFKKAIAPIIMALIDKKLKSKKPKPPTKPTP